MKKIDPTVLKETVFIALFSAVLSLLMQSVFLIIGKWSYTVLLGNLIGYAAAVINFLLMGITVQIAIKKEEKAARNTVRLSQGLRFLMMLAVALIGYLAFKSNILAVLALIIPYLFPRITILIRPLFKKF